MRLRRLDLEFFGHFAGKSYDFGPASDLVSDFHIVYGPNEAGKTTTMEAYLRLLYGFPLREDYAFKHQRPNLRVSGVLELGGVEQMFTRLPLRANNLLNARGEAVPETALQSALSSLTVEDYRKLLCLDDETIEAGGKEIAESKGDIGRLLFSAAAGVSDLSAVLDQVSERAGAFYKKGGSKSDFAQLKRELDEVNTQIKDLDVSAAQYRSLRQAVEAAQGAEAALRAERKQALQTQAQLSARAAALPLAQRLTALEAALEPLSAYPEALEIEPEELVGMLTRRGELTAIARARADEIAAKAEARGAIVVQPDLGAALGRLEGLREARGRFEAAQIDLPKRRKLRDDALEEMQSGLRELGLDAEAGVAQFVLPEAELAALETLLETLRAAEGDVVQAQREAQAAQDKHAKAAQDAAAVATPQDAGPDLKALLERENAARVFEAFTAAQADLRAAERGARAALSALDHKGQRFDAAPEGMSSAAEAAAFARAQAQAVQDLRAAQDLVAEQAARADGFARQIAVFETADLITDEAAARVRAAREGSWQAHLAAMGGATAAAFEAALRADDRSTSTRQAQAKDLGELRQIKLLAAEVEAKRAAAERQAAQAEAAVGAGAARFAAMLAAAGLVSEMTPDAFVDWAQAAARAQTAARTLADEVTAQAPALAAAAALQARLSEALSVEGVALEPLLAMARARAEAQAQAAFAAGSAQQFLTQAAQDQARRAAQLTQAEAACAAAQAAWRAAIVGRFGAQINAEKMRGAMAGLRGLRALNERLRAAERQIVGMEADQTAFLSALTGIFGDLPADPEAAMQQLEREGSAAREAQAAWARLGEEIAQAERAQAAAELDLTALEARVALLSASFAPPIATGTLEDLRAAVRSGQRAIELRAQAGEVTRELLSALNVESVAQAQAVLAGQTLEVLQAGLAEVERDLTPIDTRLTAAIEARTASEAALRAVTGAGDIAARVARRRAIEAQMQAGVMGYLEDRLGHMLADRAIRSYRDTHRNGMMRAAEEAFCDLTSGAYNGLRTQFDGAAETLVAIQASDGAAKQARDMSKGTRFQLYLALRAAAYTQMAENGTVLPFFCDDVFETFDDTRTRAACHLMHRIGRRGQAIYLTHHQHVVDIAREVCGDEVTVHHV